MRVSVVGTGYVGLVSGACLASVGHRVVCIDSERERVRAIARGETPIVEDGLPRLVKEGVASGRLSATASLAEGVEDAKVILVAVGTPCVNGGIDLSGVETAARQIGAALRGRRDRPVIAVKSTVTPGTTDSLVRRAVELETGGRAGEHFGLAMNPEFLSQGSAVHDFLDPDRIVIGEWDGRSGDVMAELYRPFAAPLLRMGLREAEMVKYAANGLQATLISYANQIAAICEAVPGIDHAAVMKAVHLDRMLDGPDGKRAGAARFLVGGIGFGGSCFPKDLVALADFARRRGVDAELIEAVSAVNAGRIDAVIGLLDRALGGLTGKRVAVLGLAFKPGTDDVRESPALKIARRLMGCACHVTTHDPLGIVRQRARALLPADIAIADTLETALTGAEAVIIATAWPEYRAWDWPAAAIVLDGRLALDGVDAGPARIVRIGQGPDITTAREGA